jgi:hypothetical protein
MKPNPSVDARSRASELEAARRRAGVAKVLGGGLAVVIFGVAAVSARQSYPGHPKRVTTPLTPPRSYVQTVRRNLLQAGIVAPPQAPPGASTSAS